MNFKNKKKNYKKKLNIFFQKFKSISSIIFTIQIFFILILFIWYFSNPVKITYPPDRLLKIFNQKTKNFVGLDFSLIDEYFKTYFLGIFYSINKPIIEKIDLNINQEALIHLEFQRSNREKILGKDIEIKKKLSKYVNANLKFNNKEFPIKLRVKGDRRIHYFKPKSTSFKVDLRKGKKIWGLEEFSLQKPVVRNYVHEYIFHSLNKKLGNISLNYKLVNLSINGVDYGLYSIEEGFSNELLEKNSRRSGPIFGIRDDVSGLYPDITYESYSEISWVAQNQSLLRSGYAILNNLKNKDQSAYNFIDWDSWAKFFAVVDLSQAYHGAISKSVRIYYNPVTAKIEPISFDGHYGTADFSNFIILDYLNSDSNCNWICGEREWFLRFLLNENNQPRKEFIEPYINYLKQLSSDEFIDLFKKENDKQISEMNKLFYSDFSRYDNIFWEGMFPYVYEKNFLENRAKIIKKKLSSTNLSNFQFSKLQEELLINFSLKSLPIKIKSNCSQYSDSIWISKNTKIKWPSECKELIIEDINFQTKNFFLFDNPSLSNNLPDNLEQFYDLENIIIGKKNGKFFYPLDNKIIIDKNMKLNKNSNLVLNEGQSIILKNNSTLAILGNIEINGTPDNKVKIFGQEPGYGSIISYDNYFSANNLEIENLIAPKLNGYTLYGGLNIINSNIDLKNVLFNNSLSEDALNIINSKSKIFNLSFLNSKSDALDIDSGISEIHTIFCDNIGNDCVDFSNSKISIDKIKATNVYDKTVSIGEKSNVKINLLDISNSEIGIAVKDNSYSEVKNFFIENSTLPIAVFVKKQEYGPASLKINSIKLTKSNEVFLVDNKSFLEISGKKINGTETGMKIESYLYGNVYGRATIR